MPRVSPDRDERLPPPDPAVLAAPTAELDIVEGSRRSRADREHARPPQVRLGGEIEINLEEGYPPVRLAFGDQLVLVEDGPGIAPDIRVHGSLPDLISLMVTPTWAGLPNPINARGRAALGMVALGRVRIEGRVGLMRRLLALIRV
jgi:hypothetical protein